MKYLTLFCLLLVGTFSAQSTTTGETKTTKIELSKEPSQCCRKTATGLKDVILLLDGKEIPEADFNKMSPNAIQSINVLKDDSAVKKYGEKARHGAIEITTKKESDDFKKTEETPGTAV